MNKGLINLWYENQDLIDIMIDADFKITGYGDTLLRFLEDVVFLKDCKLEIDDQGRLEKYKISAMFEDHEFDKTYKIIISGNLMYGSCEECDLIMFLNDYGNRERKKAIKLLLLNLIQASSVKIEYEDSKFDPDNLEESIIQGEIDAKIHEKWEEIPAAYIRNNEKFAVLFLITTYFTLLEENCSEQIWLINKKLILGQELTAEEKEKVKLYRASLNSYPMAELIYNLIE